MPELWQPRSIIAFGGRRTDAPHAGEKRFEFASVAAVRDALTDLFRRQAPLALVASAACGSDLLALDAADELGCRIRVVMPFPPQRFRETSVVDRPHPEFWGPLFDRLVGKADSNGDLVVLGLEDTSSAYAATNRAIIEEATALAEVAPPPRRLAVIAWDGASRGEGDLTQQLADLAREAGFTLLEVSTIDPDANRRRRRRA